MYKILPLAALCAASLISCSGGSDSKDRGPQVQHTSIACDATFENIMDQEIDVFEYTYNTKKRQAWIVPYYVSQRAAIDSLMSPDNNIRTIVTARTLTTQEKQRLHNRKRNVRQQRIAVDAIALIVNKENPIEVMTLDEIKAVMSGELNLWETLWPTARYDTIRVVFDQNGSSIMQFMRDSICDGRPFGPNVYAEQSTREVFDAVTRRPNAIGVVGVSWISADMDGTEISKDEMRRRSSASDTTDLNFRPDIKVIAVAPEGSARGYKPYQAYIFDGRYPLYRSVWMISTAVGGSLDNAFYAFVTGMQGQKVIQLTGILPATVQPRMVNVTRQGESD